MRLFIRDCEIEHLGAKQGAFQAGDKVRVTNDTTCHGIPLGEIITLEEAHPEHGDAFLIRDQKSSTFTGFQSVIDAVNQDARREGIQEGSDHSYGETISVRSEDGESGMEFRIVPPIDGSHESLVKLMDEFAPRPRQCRCDFDGRDCCGQKLWGEAEIVQHDFFTIVFQQWRLCV